MQDCATCSASQIVTHMQCALCGTSKNRAELIAKHIMTAPRLYAVFWAEKNPYLSQSRSIQILLRCYQHHSGSPPPCQSHRLTAAELEEQLLSSPDQILAVVPADNNLVEATADITTSLALPMLLSVDCQTTVTASTSVTPAQFMW